MTTPRPLRPKAAGPAALALALVAGVAAGVAALLGYGAVHGFGPNLPRVGVSKTPASTAPPAPAPSVAIMRPLPMPHGAQATARRATDGHFHFDTAVNGVPVRMMFDTGAGRVSLRWEDAARLGLSVNTLDFTGRSYTANGITEVAPVMLDTFRVGDIVRQNVPALVFKPGKMNVNLLGQSFMARIKGYRVEGTEMILQAD